MGPVQKERGRERKEGQERDFWLRSLGGATISGLLASGFFVSVAGGDRCESVSMCLVTRCPGFFLGFCWRPIKFTE